MAAPRALLLASLLSPFLSPLLSAVPAGAVPPPAPRNVSVLLEPGSERLRVLPGRHPGAVAWASLDDRIPHVGYDPAGTGRDGTGTAWSPAGTGWPWGSPAVGGMACPSRVRDPP